MRRTASAYSPVLSRKTASPASVSSALVARPSSSQGARSTRSLRSRLVTTRDSRASVALVAGGERAHAQSVGVRFVQCFEEGELEGGEPRRRELLVESGGQKLEQRMQSGDGDALVLRQSCALMSR